MFPTNYFTAGFNSLPRSLTNTSEEYSTSIDSSTQIDNSSVLETLIEDQEITPKSKTFVLTFFFFSIKN